MTPERWTAFVGVLLVVLCTPGPDFAVVLRHALADPRRGAKAAAGIVTGLAGHTAAAALGLSAVLAARPDVLTAVRFAGAAYLGWLGVQALRAAFARAPAAAARVRSSRPYLDGLAGNLLNPKALLFFLGLIPQFVVPGPTVTAQLLLLAGTTVLASVMWWAIVIPVVARGRAALARSRVRRAVDAATGGALLAVAVGVARG
ncbi:LysE family translocator [Pseudonocardia adelaidensis]|uniref:LysE family translocator n=1 Tax=Pseudonocardia adelaidensis TaxID=648754 RepID=A0ABP9NE50_9PSEU